MIWVFDALRAIGIALAVLLLGLALLFLASYLYLQDLSSQLLPASVVFLLLASFLVPWLVFRGLQPPVWLKRLTGWGSAVGTLLLAALMALAMLFGYFTLVEALVVFYLGLFLGALFLVRWARRQQHVAAQ